MKKSNEKYVPILAYELFKELESDNLGYIYRGYLTQKLTVDILSLTETSLDKYSDASNVKKKVYFIMMEGLQNITRHQDHAQPQLNEQSGVFFFQKKNRRYYITTGNIIENNKIADLKVQINVINSLDAEELKKYYKETLTTGRISAKGGAGLGLIEMARKSGQKLMYDFAPVDENTSYFYLHIEVPYKELDLQDENIPESPLSIEAIKRLHKMLIVEEISMSFHGLYNQDNLMFLLQIFEEQMMSGKVPLRKKIYHIMVEMLQNLVKHGESRNKNLKSSPGIFFLSSKENATILTSGNYIRRKNRRRLESILKHANKLSLTECSAYYNQVLAAFNIDSPESVGLGLVDTRMKSENWLKYDFVPIDRNYYFFSLQVTINSPNAG
ncbi:MAG TPA: hypothetical protein DCQ31_02995 [Bacteroidales bacterium]|nr:hypothetical protein [Bacteroidales bacterium]